MIILYWTRKILKFQETQLLKIKKKKKYYICIHFVGKLDTVDITRSFPYLIWSQTYQTFSILSNKVKQLLQTWALVGWR